MFDSNLGLAVFFFVVYIYIYIYFFFNCFFFLNYIFPLSLFTFILTTDITAPRGFCDKCISSNVYVTLTSSSTVHPLHIEILTPQIPDESSANFLVPARVCDVEGGAAHLAMSCFDGTV